MEAITNQSQTTAIDSEPIVENSTIWGASENTIISEASEKSGSSGGSISALCRLLHGSMMRAAFPVRIIPQLSLLVQSVYSGVNSTRRDNEPHGPPPSYLLPALLVVTSYLLLAEGDVQSYIHLPLAESYIDGWPPPLVQSYIAGPPALVIVGVLGVVQSGGSAVRGVDTGPSISPKPESLRALARPSPEDQSSLRSFTESSTGATTDGDDPDAVAISGPDDGDPPEQNSDSREKCVIYARVSSNEQAEQGTSLDEQVSSLRAIARERNLEVAEVIQDDGESGTDFDRAGIKRVWQLAQRDEISHVLVDDVDRVGRHAAETIYYLYELREGCDVTIITNASGEVDVSTFEGLVETMFRALSSQMANENKRRRAHDSRVTEFKNKNWTAFYDEAPLGYSLTDDDWLTIDQDEVAYVETLFEAFLQAGNRGPYTRAAEAVQDKGVDIDSRKAKALLQKSVYVGVPSVDTTFIGRDTDEDCAVDDPELQFIDEETFEQAQEKIERVRQYHSNAGDDTDEVGDLIEEFGPRSVIEIIECVEVRCPDCGGIVVKNGQRTLDDRRVHNYLCKDCGRQFKVPTQGELTELQERGRGGGSPVNAD